MSEVSQVLLMVLSILIVLGLESFKKPKLLFKIGDFGEIKPNDPLGRTPSKWTHVFVYNEPMPKLLSWIWDRSPALSCRGWITFHDLDGQDLFGRKMKIRWANNPEPLLIDPKTGNPSSIDWDKMRIGHLWDIPPGTIEHNDYGILDIVFRSADDENVMVGITTHTYIIGKIVNGYWVLEDT